MKYAEYFKEYTLRRKSLKLSPSAPAFPTGSTLVQFAQSGANREATSRNKWVENFSAPDYAQTVNQDYYPCENIETVVVRLHLNSPAYKQVMDSGDDALDWNSFQSLEGWHW